VSTNRKSRRHRSLLGQQEGTEFVTCVGARRESSSWPDSFRPVGWQFLSHQYAMCLPSWAYLQTAKHYYLICPIPTVTKKKEKEEEIEEEKKVGKGKSKKKVEEEGKRNRKSKKKEEEEENYLLFAGT
jgi:hypothetical protein